MNAIVHIPSMSAPSTIAVNIKPSIKSSLKEYNNTMVVNVIVHNNSLLID